MSIPTPTEENPTGTWSNYQLQLYAIQPPPFTTLLSSLPDLAKEALDSKPYWYIAGSAGEGKTDDANKKAFDDWSFVPRMLRDGNKRDLRITLEGIGEKLKAPIIIGPVGVCGIFHKDGELAVARAAANLGLPMVMSTAATRSIEAVAKENGVGNPKWYQLYWPRSNDITISLLNRAKASGFTTLVLTLDTTLLGHRPHDLDTGFLPFLQGDGCQVGFSDPVFCKKMGIEVSEDYRTLLGEEGGKDVEEKKGLVGKVSRAWLGEVNSGCFRTWEDVKFLQENWKGPIILKGIQNPADAKKAHSMGLSGIIVSNHGGRQIDGSISSLSALASITSDPYFTPSVLSSFDILFDSGIRSGNDALKAIALGAKAVLIGRPWVYGLAIGGDKGVEHVIRTLANQMELEMGLMGVQKIGDLKREDLRYTGK